VQPPRDPGPIEFVRMRRARRYILRVRPDGTLRVTVPRGGSRRQAEAFVTQNFKWIDRERSRVRREHSPTEWHDGSEIMYRGALVRIGVEQRADRCEIRYGDRAVAVQAGADVRSAVEDDLRALARAALIPRLQTLAQTHELHLGRVTIRDQRSRWGSCTRSGNIALNFRLMQMPPDVCDYVLIHELMHIRQQNHSRRFWKLVAAACPAFRECERWLRAHGRSLF
jgi:predicted metal-dependent hydrolase